MNCLVIYGTRPEVIKLAPVIQALRRAGVETTTCNTSQHTEMSRQALRLFGLKSDYDLDLMTVNQTPEQFFARAIVGLTEIFKKTQSSLALVQGDTSTALAGAMAAFYQRVPVAHVEAGLRTYDRDLPFPEEIHRQLIGSIASVHFAPTAMSRDNLLKEGKSPASVIVSGNTVVDALKLIPLSEPKVYSTLPKNKKLLLVTIHRRESFGEPMKRILSTIKTFLSRHSEFHAILPVHPNPNVRSVVNAELQNTSSVTLCEPLDYTELLFVLKASECVLTDSGGIQEEAPSFRKPVIVLRSVTERMEGVEAGCAFLVGHDEARLAKKLDELAKGRLWSLKSPSFQNPFGDGKASERIADYFANLQSAKKAA